MEVLEADGLAQAIREFAASGRPVLGICLGAQIIFERSEERDTPCLGLLTGTVRRFPANLRAAGLKIPHMGWNRVFRRGVHPLLAGIPDGAFFYFVHSFYPDPADPELVLAACDYGLSFAAGVGRGNLAAFQFHPEKSGADGLRLLANFLAWEP
jgi:glutamine amidotransferase